MVERVPTGRAWQRWGLRDWLLACVGAAAIVAASPVSAQELDNSAQCEVAIASAEHAQSLPPGLLGAIALVETGRFDPARQTRRPWPWSVNADGVGYMFATKAEAVGAVSRLLDSGIRSIDVGCLQVNLMYHPTAFTDLEQAFDPTANTAYAASFLRSLYAELMDWAAAAAAYHSRTADIAAVYQQRVMATWGTGVVPGTQVAISPQLPRLQATGPISPFRPFAPPRLPDVPITDIADTRRMVSVASACADAAAPAPTPWVALRADRSCGVPFFSTPAPSGGALAWRDPLPR